MCSRSNSHKVYLAPGVDTVDTEEMLAAIELSSEGDVLKADGALP